MPRRKPRKSRLLFRFLLLGFATSVLADATRPQPAPSTRPKLPTPPPPPPVPTLERRPVPSPRPPVTPLEFAQAPMPVAAEPPALLAERPAPPRATEWLRTPEPPAEPAAKAGGRRRRVRRVGATIFLSTAFFAGAAFSAAAGNEVVKAFESTDSADSPAAVETASSLDASAQPTSTDADTADAGTLQEPVAQPSEQAPAQVDAGPAASGAAPAQVEQTISVQPSAPAAPKPTSSAPVQVVHVREGAPKAASTHSAPKRPQPTAAKHVQVVTVHAARASSPVLARALGKHGSPLDPEAHTPGAAAAVWLNRPAPDPTPPSRRLTALFADQLATTARAHGVDWALVLATLRADGRLQPAPAERSGLVTLERRLGSLGARNDAWAAALKLAGDTTFADRTLALQRYYSAVGLRALVTGLEAAKPDLERRVLADQRLQIYPGGRSDIERHRVDVRVLALLEYLAGTYRQVTVSCLISGHRLYARPGVVSAHIYGRAVDISALDGIPIAGHQQPGGIVEKAVRSILLLPGEVEPRQVISLLGLGGASFPLANHWNHVHVGY